MLAEETSVETERSMTPSARGFVVSACVLGLAACGSGGETEAGSSNGAFTGVPVLALSNAGAGGAEQVRAYRWEGNGTVPWPFDGALGRALFGAIGRTPSTLLYLTFDGPLAREATEQT